MKKPVNQVVCLEILKRNPITDEFDVDFKYPLVEMPKDVPIGNRKHAEFLIKTHVYDNILQLCLLTKIGFALDIRHPHSPYRFGLMDWKWTPEYFANLKPSPKGASRDDKD